MKQIGIIGSGSWGTALSVLLAGNADKVIVWGREPSVIASINSLHQNPGYLPNVVLPDHVSATTTLADLATCDAIFVVVPSKAVRPVAQQLATLPLPPETPLVSCIKGIENGSGLRMSQLLSDAMPAQPVAVLSGPNHAEEIARRQPAAAVIGCTNQLIARRLQQPLPVFGFDAVIQAEPLSPDHEALLGPAILLCAAAVVSSGNASRLLMDAARGGWILCGLSRGPQGAG